MRPRLVNCIAFDDCPFPRDFKGHVQIVGTVYGGNRLDGVLTGQVEKDGTDAAMRIVEIVRNSRFYQHCNLIMLQGICLGGFNVVDARLIQREISRPVLVVARKEPDYQAIKDALLRKIPDGDKKWQIIQNLGPMEPCKNCFIQRVGLDYPEAEAVIDFFCVNSNIPEPLRTAHLIAGALGRGSSRGRV